MMFEKIYPAKLLVFLLEYYPVKIREI